MKTADRSAGAGFTNTGAWPTITVLFDGDYPLMLAMALSLLPIAPPPAPPPEPPRAVTSWTCFASEQIDQHVSGMLEMLVYPDGSRDSLSYYLNWAQQPGYMAEQQMSWIWIPLDAVKLWKPDAIELSVRTDRDGQRGSVTFASPKFGRIMSSQPDILRSLRPDFNMMRVRMEDGYLVAQLWNAWRWKAELFDAKGTPLATQEILLPGPDEAQAIFTRLRAALDRRAQDPAANCSANLEPDEWDRAQQVITIS